VAFRDGPFQALKSPLTWVAAVVAVLVGVIALGFLLTDHRNGAENGAYGAARGEFDEALEPVVNVISAPARWITSAGEGFSGYFFAVSQNRELKKQVSELQRWRDAAIALKNLNLRYESLLKLRTDPPIPMVSARVVSDARGPFSQARLANAGSADGVKIGNPAMSEDGVVGRVVGVTRNACRILLLTDVESRTPVLIDRTNARAILTGDGGPNPKLEFVHGLNSVKDGDMVLTSGDGGLYPRGLPVGVAAKDYRGVWRVQLYSDRASIDFVRILVFDDFSQMVSQAQLAQSAMPEEQTQLQAARAAAEKPAASPTATPTTPATTAAVPPTAPPTAAKQASPPARPTTEAATPTPAGSTPRAPTAAPSTPSKPHTPKPKTPAKSKASSKPKIPKGAFHPDAGVAQSAADRGGG
jgi:rod shape-determining protein MreC